MKRIAIIPIMLALTACDKPIAETILIPCCDMHDEYGPIKVKVFNNKNATATIQGHEIKLTPTPDFSTFSEQGIEWEGVYNNETITIHSYFDKVNRLLIFHGISDNHHTGSFGTDTGLDIDFPEYKAPNKQEICMNELNSIIRNSSTGDIFITQRMEIKINGRNTFQQWHHKIPHNDAVKINPAWDKNPVETAGDACATLDAVKKYISTNNIAKQITLNWNDITCASPKEIHLGCNNFERLSYTYMQLNICDNGQHILIIGDEPGIFGRNNYVQMTGTNTPDGIVYSGTLDNITKYEIIYNAADNTYSARNFDASGAYSICDQGELKPHQICARKIHNLTILNPDNTVALDIDGRQKAIENGFKAEHKYITLTQEQALKVSKNWDYKNIKLYTQGNEPHERDACETWQRLIDLKWDIIDQTDK